MSARHRTKLAQVHLGQNSHFIGSVCCHNEPIASGTFGNVFVGLQNDSREVAVRSMERENVAIGDLIKLSECKNIVRYFHCQDLGSLYITQELMEGNLMELLRNSITFEREECIRGILNAISALHDIGVFPLCITPSRILYKWRGEQIILKLSYLGKVVNSDVPASMKCWMAPELLNGTMQNSKASDMFAFGLVFHYMLSGKHPFSPNNEVDEDVVTNIQENRLVISKALSFESRELAEHLLKNNKDHRPSMEEARQHPFFWSTKKKCNFLKVAGNCSEIKLPRHRNKKFMKFVKAKGAVQLSGVEQDIELVYGVQFLTNPWHEVVPEIYDDLTNSENSREYRTDSAVELIRFVRNAYEHADELTSSNMTSVKKDHVLLKKFPTLVVVIYRTMKKYEWDKQYIEIDDAIKS